MPHYLIHGADQSTAESRLHITFSNTDDETLNSASDAGLFVSKIEVLDAGHPAKPSDGTSGGWLRMATILSKQDRFDDAVELLQLIYKLVDVEGEDLGFAAYLKLPNYLVKAGRRDDAWKYFCMLKIGKVEGTRGVRLLPANLGDIHRRMAKLCRGEASQRHMLISRVCDLVGEVFVGRCRSSDGVDEIKVLFEESSFKIDDPESRANEIGKHLSLLDGNWGPDYPGIGLRAAYSAEAIIQDATA